jgi:hypothetical protein
VAVGRVLDGDALRGWEGGVVGAVSLAVLVDGMVSVGVVIGSTDVWGLGVVLVNFDGPAESVFDGVSNSCGRTCVGQRTGIRQH